MSQPELRVTLVAFACDPTAGSEPFNGWMWAYSLAQRGVACQVITRRVYADAVTRQGGTSPPSGISLRYIEDGDWLFRVFPRRAAMYLNYLRFLRRASGLLKHVTEPGEVVHHVTWGSLTLGTVRQPFGRRLVWGPVGGSQTTPWRLRPYFEHQWWWEVARNCAVRASPYLLPTLRRSVRRADVIFATNRQTRATAERLGARDVRLLPADALVESLPPRVGDKDKILWVGRMFPIKGANLAVRIFAELADVNESSRLTLVGDGPEMANVKRLAVRLGVASRVTFTGAVPRAEVEKYYGEAGVFLFTSLRDSFGAQLLEAARHSNVLVLFDHQAGSSMIPRGSGLVIPSFPTRTLPRRAAQVINSMLNRNDLIELGSSAQRFASEHTWDARAKMALAVYNGREAGS